MNTIKFELPVLVKTEVFKLNDVELQVTFDFKGVTKDEIQRFLVSQTNVLKQWINNHGRKMKADELKKVNGTTISVRELLDGRKRKPGSASPERQLLKEVKKMKEQKLTKEQKKQRILELMEQYGL